MRHYSYIAIEGIDGAGKSEQIALLADKLRARDLTPILTCEPTYSRFGQIIRQRMTTGKIGSLDDQIRLFTLDRKEHVRTRLRPLLKLAAQHKKFIVLQHRYYLSAPAYQGRTPPEMQLLLKSQQKIAPTPDIVILLDLPPTEALNRLKTRDGQKNVFERAAILDAVRKRYLNMAETSGEPVYIVNATGQPQTVAQRVWRVLARHRREANPSLEAL